MPSDTGARLRALYENEGGVANVFSGKVADYVSSRPDYPDALFEQLKLACATDPASGFLKTALAEVETEVRKTT